MIQQQRTTTCRSIRKPIFKHRSCKWNLNLNFGILTCLCGLVQRLLNPGWILYQMEKYSGCLHLRSISIGFLCSFPVDKLDPGFVLDKPLVLVVCFSYHNHVHYIWSVRRSSKLLLLAANSPSGPPHVIALDYQALLFRALTSLTYIHIAILSKKQVKYYINTTIT